MAAARRHPTRRCSARSAAAGGLYQATASRGTRTDTRGTGSRGRLRRHDLARGGRLAELLHNEHLNGIDDEPDGCTLEDGLEDEASLQPQRDGGADLRDSASSRAAPIALAGPGEACARAPARCRG